MHLAKYPGLHILVFALAVLFGFDLTLVRNPSNAGIAQDQVCLKSAQASNHNGFPFDSRAAFPGSETPDKSDQQEEVDTDDDSKEGRNYSVEANAAQRSLEFSLLCCKKSFEHRPQVSLFILYHSWKRYLS
jgi:hypothetical protein